MRIHKVTLLQPVLLAIVLTPTLASTGGKVSIKEWEVPTPNSRPHDPTVAPDGSLWYTGQRTNKLGRLDPQTGQFKEYPLKPPGSGPHGLVADREGNIWFTVIAKGYVGKLDPKTGQVKSTKVPTPHAVPYGIVVTSAGVPYFCEFGSNKLASIDPKNLTISEYPLPQQGARLRGLAPAADGTIYYTDYARGYLGHFDPASKKFEEWPSPGGAGSEPYGIAMALRWLRIGWCGTANQVYSLIRWCALIPKPAFTSTVVPSGGGVIREYGGDAGWPALSGLQWGE
jgi:virginiamycin B lyase